MRCTAEVWADGGTRLCGTPTMTLENLSPRCDRHMQARAAPQRGPQGKGKVSAWHDRLDSFDRPPRTSRR